MKNIKRLFQTMLASFVVALALVATPLSPTPVSAASCAPRAVLSFPAWYKGLDTKVEDGKCVISKFELNDVWVIVMNGIEILLQAVAYVSVAFIIWGGFKYIKSEGEPNRISEAKSAIINAIMGLAIALASVAIVTFIQSRII